MLVIGAKGFATQLFDILHQLKLNKQIAFYDDTAENGHMFLGKYDILNDRSQVIEYFKKDNRFCLGLGNPNARNMIFDKFIDLGGVSQTIISPFAHIGNVAVTIGEGTTILTNAVVESCCTLGKGTLVNLAVTITHNSFIGDFCEFSPGVHISGGCIIGNNCSFGTGAVVLPKIIIGNNVVVGAGAVVTRDVQDNSFIVGVPAKEKFKDI